MVSFFTATSLDRETQDLTHYSLPKNNKLIYLRWGKRTKAPRQKKPPSLEE